MTLHSTDLLSGPRSVLKIFAPVSDVIHLLEEYTPDIKQFSVSTRHFWILRSTLGDPDGNHFRKIRERRIQEKSLLLQNVLS